MSKFKEADEQYDIWLRAEHSDRMDAEAIGMIAVPSAVSPSGTVELSNVVDFEKAMGPNSIDRFGRQRQVVVSGNLDGIDLSTA